MIVSRNRSVKSDRTELIIVSRNRSVKSFQDRMCECYETGTRLTEHTRTCPFLGGVWRMKNPRKK